MLKQLNINELYSVTGGSDTDLYDTGENLGEKAGKIVKTVVFVSVVLWHDFWFGSKSTDSSSGYTGGVSPDDRSHSSDGRSLY